MLIKNCMHESLAEFDRLCSRVEQSRVILVFTKVDLFKKNDLGGGGGNLIRQCFPEYAGQDPLGFIAAKFKERAPKLVHSHFVCATDAMSVSATFETIVHQIIAKVNILILFDLKICETFNKIYLFLLISVDSMISFNQAHLAPTRTTTTTSTITLFIFNVECFEKIA